jgi:hypothetical protein
MGTAESRELWMAPDSGSPLRTRADGYLSARVDESRDMVWLLSTNGVSPRSDDLVNGREELEGAKRLWHVSVSPSRESFICSGVRRDHDDAELVEGRYGARCPAHVQSINDRHSDIENDDIRSFIAENTQRFFTIRCFDHSMSPFKGQPE